MRKLIIVTTAILLLGSIPATTAKHLSTGVQDGAGFGPSETPNERSVEGEEIAGDGTPYGVATQTDCYEAEGSLDPGEAETATNADSLCGELVYHQGTEKEVTSDPDQTIFDPISSFDVIHTQSYRTMTATGVAADVVGAETGTDFTYCIPLCPPGSTYNPTGDDTVFDAFHNAASLVGLTEGPNDAREGETPNRGQHYAANVYAPGPGVTAQGETDAWDLNGWMVPHVENTFIAYPEGPEGDIITAEELEDIVSEAKGNDKLGESNVARICAYSPDVELTTVAPGAAGTRCELPFRFRGEPADDGGEAMFDGYDDRCASPTYVCGAANGPAWYAEFCLCFGFMNPEIPGAGPATNATPLVNSVDQAFLGDEGSQTDYLRWHHVIAPRNSGCQGALEPTFNFEPEAGADQPYLAHDVDIYVPATTVSNAPNSRSVQTTIDYGQAAADQAVETALQQIDLPAVPDDPTEAVNEATTPVAKSDLMEPNLAQPVGGLDDTSRQEETGDALERNLDGFCEQLLSNEASDTVDDWVDYIDATAVSQTTQYEPYNTEDENHDSTNRPGPNVYATSGNVGMFTDTDDDGAYAPASGGVKYEQDTVQEQGAYPMMWDMVVDENGNIDRDGGCSPSDDVNLVKAMDELGYGANTAMVQAIYLNEPTTFIEPNTGGATPYTAGQNVYLLMSDAARYAHENDVDPIASQIDELVANLKAYAAQQNDGLTAGDVGVETPAQDLGLDRGFEPQCNGGTGNFDSRVQFIHSCQLDCTADTIATMYTFELTDSEGELEGAPLLPGFYATNDEDPYDFGPDQHTWYDIDPFDNDPERNEERQSPPPTGD